MVTTRKEYNPQTGIETTIHELETKTVIQKSFDGDVFKERAKVMRDATEGQSWGDGKYVGTIPAAVYSEWLRHGYQIEEKAKEWLKANPDMVAFSKYLR